MVRYNFSLARFEMVEVVHLTLNNIMTMKCGLCVTQGH